LLRKRDDIDRIPIITNSQAAGVFHFDRMLTRMCARSPVFLTMLLFYTGDEYRTCTKSPCNSWVHRLTFICELAGLYRSGPSNPGGQTCP
jgi:hypothetical protein